MKYCKGKQQLRHFSSVSCELFSHDNYFQNLSLISQVLQLVVLLEKKAAELVCMNGFSDLDLYSWRNVSQASGSTSVATEVPGKTAVFRKPVADPANTEMCG